MKIYKKQFSAKDLLEVALDPSTRVGSTPFGAAEGEMTIYMGKSVPWKGVKGLENLRAVNPKVAAGLEKAREISKRHTEPGVAMVQFPNGEVEMMPMKCYQMMKEVERPVTMIRGISVGKRPWIVKKAKV